MQYSQTPIRGTLKMLTELIKLYSEQEKKFRGELYNILNLKLHIFYNYC